MSVDRVVFALAGFMVLVSLLLGHIHSIYWHYFTAFIGLNMFQAAFTRFCPLEIILRKFVFNTRGINKGKEK